MKSFISFILGNRRILKLLRFCVVGGTAFILSILIFNVLKNTIEFFRIHFVIASVIGDLSGLIYGFYINKHWTYAKQKSDQERYFFKYMLLYATTISLNGLLLKFFIWVLTNYEIFAETISQNIKENIAKILATAITTLLNFVITNYVIFIHEGEEEDDEMEVIPPLNNG